MSEWVTVATTDEVPDGELAAATLDGLQIVLANSGGEYRAFADECTHAGCSLAYDGELEGDNLTCQCHGSVFDLSTGEAIGPPATAPVAVYRVRVEGDEIQVARPAG
jgi:3-phenylpropionate/trans-cinnamate dioxygenase ferredoxin component